MSRIKSRRRYHPALTDVRAGAKLQGMQVLSLSDVPPQRLEEIFEQEVRYWKDELFWDYRPAVAMIGKLLASRTLPGCAVQNRTDSVIGYSYYVIHQPVGYIGSLYVRSEYASSEAYHRLLEKSLRLLKSSGKVRRIESQVFAFNFDFEPLFRQLGFTTLKRYFLTLPLDQIDGQPPLRDQPARFRILGWEHRLIIPAAEVVYNSYRGSADYTLCRDYQSREGCIRFLRNLLDNAGCGTFTRDLSYLGLDERGGVCAVLVTSRISPDTGMIPQVSVRGDCQGKGLGTWLLQTYFQQAKKQGLRRITLSVSATNQRAYQLYRQLGFRKAKDFHAFIWNAA